MSLKLIAPAIAGSLLLMCAVAGEASAQYWEAQRPSNVRTPGRTDVWALVWTKQGVPWFKGQWNHECSIADQPPRNYDTGRRHLAVWVANPGWVVVECYKNNVEYRQRGVVGSPPPRWGGGVISCPGHPDCYRYQR